MTDSITAKRRTVAEAKAAAKAKSGRVFTISMTGIPKVTKETRAKLELGARSPSSSRRDYPILVVDI